MNVFTLNSCRQASEIHPWDIAELVEKSVENCVVFKAISLENWQLSKKGQPMFVFGPKLVSLATVWFRVRKSMIVKETVFLRLFRFFLATSGPNYLENADFLYMRYRALMQAACFAVPILSEDVALCLTAVPKFQLNHSHLKLSLFGATR